MREFEPVRFRAMRMWGNMTSAVGQAQCFLIPAGFKLVDPDGNVVPPNSNYTTDKNGEEFEYVLKKAREHPGGLASAWR
jgi:hypothetical protein